MYSLSSRLKAKFLLEEGLSKSAVARILGVNRRTISRWLTEPNGPKKRKRRTHKLDPYKATVRQRLCCDPTISVARLFEIVRADGYDGSYSRVRDYVRQVRKRSLDSSISW